MSNSSELINTTVDNGTETELSGWVEQTLDFR